MGLESSTDGNVDFKVAMEMLACIPGRNESYTDNKAKQMLVSTRTLYKCRHAGVAWRSLSDLGGECLVSAELMSSKYPSSLVAPCNHTIAIVQPYNSDSATIQ